MVTSHQIKAWGREIGFDGVGIAPAGPIDQEHRRAYEKYLERGFQGEMGYLARNVEKRIDVRELVPGARNVICTATNYYTGDEPPGRQAGRLYGKVARYAWGRDYHVVLKQRLRQLADRIREAVGGDVLLRRFVDTAPVAEREYAARAGLGWIGKNGLLLNKRLGSWLLLGEIVTDLELDCDEPGLDHCGTCTRCLEACPTKAFVGPGVLNPLKCISYLTIESRQPVPEELQAPSGDWVFGCDVCQEVCPFNRRAPRAKDADFVPREHWASVDLNEADELNDKSFTERFAGSAQERTSAEHLKDVARVCRANLAAEKAGH